MSVPKPTNVNDLGAILRAIAAASGLHENIAGDTSVDYHEQDNRKIILPGNPSQMSLTEAAARLTALDAFNDQTFQIREQIPGMPLDAAHAFVQVLRERYGWAETTSSTKQGFFGPIKEAPEMRRVITGSGPNDYIEVPVGDFKLPDISTEISTGFERSNTNRNVAAYFVKANVRHKDRELIMGLISKAKEYLEKNSIYRGKAMRLRVDENGVVNYLFEPEFIDVMSVDETCLVHPRATEVLLESGLFTLIRKAEMCRKHKIPLKRTALLYGPYGTGKTFTSSVTAKLGINHDWTFVTVDNARGLAGALEFARRYQPAIVFAEDIDRVMSQRDEPANDLLNVIDGILGKGNVEVITVLTTNHIEKIEPAMLRPGRIDMIVPIDLPDAEAAARMIRVYGRDLVAETVDLTEVGKVMDGFIPAAIREAIERAKMHMVMDNRTYLSKGDLLAAALSMKAHADLSKPRGETVSDAEAFGIAAQKLLGMNGHGKLIEEIHEATTS